MKLPGSKSAGQLARWLSGRLAGGALILGYHRVADASLDPFSMCVNPRHLAEQLDVLRTYAHPISLRDLVKHIQNGQLPKRAVVITFDDGYAGLLQAQALLERYCTPATIFVAPAYLGHEFWWDELARMLLSPAALPVQLALDIGGGLYEWAPRVTLDVDAGGNPATSRHRLLIELYRRILPLSPEEREQVMAELSTWAGPEAEAAPRYHALSADQLTQLAAAPWIDIGLHSMTHPLLARMPLTAQQAEIREGRARLETFLANPITTFSYPNGSYSKETIALVQGAGFECACASQSGLAWHRGQLFRLPRLWVPDWDGVRFRRWVRKWI